MKTFLVGAAAAAALIAPGVAAADTIGAIDFTLESTDYDNNFSDFDAYALGGGVATDISHGLRLQLDGRTLLQEFDGSTSGDTSHSYAAAHLSGDLASVNVGGFVGIVNYFGSGGTLLGVEARRGFGNFVVDGSIGHADFDDNGYDGTSYRVGGSYFFSPNFSVTGGYGLTAISSSQDHDVTEWSLGGAYQFANNVEVFGAYTDSENDRSISADYEYETLQLGVRLNIGSGSLHDNATGGLWDAARQISETWTRW